VAGAVSTGCPGARGASSPRRPRRERGASAGPNVPLARGRVVVLGVVTITTTGQQRFRCAQLRRFLPDEGRCDGDDGGRGAWGRGVAPGPLAARRARLLSVAGVAGGVGASTVATVLGAADRGVFVGRAVDVLVCRATGDSLIRAGRAAQLVAAAGGRGPVLAVTAADASGPSRPVTARLRLLEPHTAAVVVLPFVHRWRELAVPFGRRPRPARRAAHRAAPRPAPLRPRRARPAHRIGQPLPAPDPPAARASNPYPGPREDTVNMPMAAVPNPAPTPPPGLGELAGELLG
jgi:hypothetical protein